MTDQAQRQPDGTFGAGNRASPYGRGARKRRAEQQAERDEAERIREESALVSDLGHVPSYTERAIIEQLSALIVRGRRLRQAGQGADAEMISRLVIRGLGRLGIRQGKPKANAAAAGLDYIREKYGQPADEAAR
jgi:hypothetical protein